jgi:Cu(I)/Ag(I) efflux system periplasmic protein CusF
MKSKMCIVILAGAIVFTSPNITCSWAQSGLADGQVTKVDPSAGKITIKHGPMKKLDMEEGMTMVYRVQNPSMLKEVKAGEKIKFDAEKVNGQLTVTKIERAK